MGLPTRALERWMDDHTACGPGPVTDAVALAGGTQNTLIRFAKGGRCYVLRMAAGDRESPAYPRLNRETQILSALARSDVPHPHVVGAEDGDAVLGRPFFVMDYVDGFAPSGTWPAGFRADVSRLGRLGYDCLDALLALRRFDHQAQGLAGPAGRGDFLERQVPRWRWQLDSYPAGTGRTALNRGLFERVAGWLEEHLPPDRVPSLMHGDFHLGNVLISPRDGRLCAVIDWELAAVGDARLDLAHFLMCWPAQDPPTPVAEVLPVPRVPGIPPSAQLLAYYQREAGGDVTHMRWFHILAGLRMAVLLEGTSARATAGYVKPDVGARFGRAAAACLLWAQRSAE
jgi:aminoglycoside phosphotransferase (APT) family kinase protein